MTSFKTPKISFNNKSHLEKKAIINTSQSDPKITKGEESNLWSSSPPHDLPRIAFLPLFVAERHLILSLSDRIINVDGGNKPLRQRMGERGHEMIKVARGGKDDSLGVRASLATPNLGGGGI